MGENSNTFEVHPDNIVPVTLEDLSEEERKEIQRELEEEMRQKLKLAAYHKTRNGVIKKLNFIPPHNPEVSKPISAEEIAHLIDASVASKFGISNSMTNITHEINDSFISKLDEFKERFYKNFDSNLPREVRSVMLQVNDEQLRKHPVLPENYYQILLVDLVLCCPKLLSMLGRVARIT